MAENYQTIALVGNPNTGKSTIFNGLTGLKQKTANYPGVTVERKTGLAKIGEKQFHIIDLPGTYSLNYKKIDERITYQTIIGEYEHENSPDLILLVVDSGNLNRNLFLATQVMDTGTPVLIVLNMDDAAREKGITINRERIQQKLGVPVISVSAIDNRDIDKVKNAVLNYQFTEYPPLKWQPDKILREAVDVVINQWIIPYTRLTPKAHITEALRLIGCNQLSSAFYESGEIEIGQKIVNEARSIIENAGRNPMAIEVLNRYDFISDCTDDAVTRTSDEKETFTDKIDTIVTHRVFGPVLFVLILILMFQSIFTWANPFMDLIDLIFVGTGSWLSTNMPPGILTDLLVEGVIAGLGGVVIFLPQILFLFFFINILEDSGYMARAALLMNNSLSRIGLHGRSVVPLVSGFACAIPGIMATRSIENWRDRIITIMVLPFMSCSARLPVYALLIAAFIPQQTLLGFIGLQGATFFGLYLFGIIIAAISVMVMSRFFIRGKQNPFIMELPDYRMPKWSVVLHNTFDRGKIFVTEAGKIIIAISIVLWFLASFPKTEPALIQFDTIGTDDILGIDTGSSVIIDETPDSHQLKNSYAGQFGNFIEPVIRPLGFDWKIGIGLITSFAAREVMVGTLNTIYSIESDNSDIVTLKQKLIDDINPETGKPVYSIATALSLMVFFALAMQCMSTIAIVRRETNSWKWPLAMFGYMTALAYICSFITFQVVSLF